jgi:YfiR/HmsC-like
MPLPTPRAPPRPRLRARATALPPWLHGARACLLVLLLACAPGQAGARPGQPPQADVSLEYAVKATYLYKLAPFVNWPPTTFGAADEPFRICVAGDDPFGDYLEKAVAGHRLGTHPFEVRRLDALTPDAACQIVFISHLPSQSIHDALDAVSGRPVLTVLDSTAPHQGGIVQFVIERGRVRFVIDTGEAARNHISISSKLLNLAVAVREPT